MTKGTRAGLEADSRSSRVRALKGGGCIHPGSWALVPRRSPALSGPHCRTLLQGGGGWAPILPWEMMKEACSGTSKEDLRQGSPRGHSIPEAGSPVSLHHAEPACRSRGQAGARLAQRPLPPSLQGCGRR